MILERIIWSIIGKMFFIRISRSLEIVVFFYVMLDIFILPYTRLVPHCYVSILFVFNTPAYATNQICLCTSVAAYVSVLYKNRIKATLESHKKDRTVAYGYLKLDKWLRISGSWAVPHFFKSKIRIIYSNYIYKYS